MIWGKSKLRKKMRKLGIKKADKIPYGWGDRCHLEVGSIYFNPKSPSIKRLVVSEPEAIRAKTDGYSRMCWKFDALVLRNGKSKLQNLRVFHDELKKWEVLSDDPLPTNS